jgi:hypothetical protein
MRVYIPDLAGNRLLMSACQFQIHALQQNAMRGFVTIYSITSSARCASMTNAPRNNAC